MPYILYEMAQRCVTSRAPDDQSSPHLPQVPFTFFVMRGGVPSHVGTSYPLPMFVHSPVDWETAKRQLDATSQCHPLPAKRAWLTRTAAWRPGVEEAEQGPDADLAEGAETGHQIHRAVLGRQVTLPFCATKFWVDLRCLRRARGLTVSKLKNRQCTHPTRQKNNKHLIKAYSIQLNQKYINKH